MDLPPFSLWIGGHLEQDRLLPNDAQPNTRTPLTLRIPTLDVLTSNDKPHNAHLLDTLRSLHSDPAYRTRDAESIIRKLLNGAKSQPTAIAINPGDFHPNTDWALSLYPLLCHARDHHPNPLHIYFLTPTEPYVKDADAQECTALPLLSDPRTRHFLRGTLAIDQFIPCGTRDLVGNLRYDIGGTAQKFVLVHLSSATNNDINSALPLAHTTLHLADDDDAWATHTDPEAIFGDTTCLTLVHAGHKLGKDLLPPNYLTLRGSIFLTTDTLLSA